MFFASASRASAGRASRRVLALYPPLSPALIQAEINVLPGPGSSPTHPGSFTGCASHHPTHPGSSSQEGFASGLATGASGFFALFRLASPKEIRYARLVITARAVFDQSRYQR